MTDDRRITFSFDFNPEAISILIESLLGTIKALRSANISLRARVVDLEKSNKDLAEAVIRASTEHAATRAQLLHERDVAKRAPKRRARK